MTTDHILAETYALIRVRPGFGAAQRFLESMRTSPQVDRVFVPESWEAATETLLFEHSDQDFSYVDATSLVTMCQRSLTAAFAFDHHFLVAGFTLLSTEP